MGTITATPDPVHGYVYLEIDFSDQAFADYAAVLRVNVATGEETLVRVHTSELNGYIYLDEGTATLYDTEAPLDTLVYYRVQVFAANAGVINANPYFETDTSDWGITGTSTLAQSNTQAHQGTFSMRVTPAGGSANGAWTPAYPATGQIYSVSGWFYAAAGWATMSIALVWLDAGGNTLSTSSQAFAIPAATWTQSVASFTKPVGATQMRFRVRQDGAPAGGDIWFVDEAKLFGTLSILASSDQIVLASSGGLWIKDPLRPFNDRPVVLKFNGSVCIPGHATYFMGLSDEDYASRTEAPIVINKRNPIAVSRVRGSMASTLNLVARTFVDRDLMKTILDPGTPLLLQAPSKYGIDDTYMSIGNVRIARMSTDMRQQWRRLELPFVAVDRPAGLMYGVLGARWRDMCDVYATFGDVTTAGISWQGVMQGQAGAPGTGINTGWATWTSVVAEYATWTAVNAAVATWEDLVDG